MLEQPKVICFTQSKDDKIFDVVVDDIRLLDDDLDKQRYIDLAGEGITDPSDDNGKWFDLVISKKDSNIIRGYLIPDNPGPRGRFRPCIFYAKTDGRTNDDIVSSLLVALNLLEIEASDLRKEDFKKKLLDRLDVSYGKIIAVVFAIIVSTYVVVKNKLFSKRSSTKTNQSKDDKNERM